MLHCFLKTGEDALGGFPSIRLSIHPSAINECLMRANTVLSIEVLDTWHNVVG